MTMALTNHERIGKGLDLLKAGLGPFVEREMDNIYGEESLGNAAGHMGDDRLTDGIAISEWDAGALLKLMWNAWNDVFRVTLGFSERSIVSELRDVRNKWAHQKLFSSDDTDRGLDSMERLLMAVSAPEADEVRKMKMELRRRVYDEQARAERRKPTGPVLETVTTHNLKPWREIITPHKDVASGRYKQAEFAADLWQVYLGEGSDEYRDPVEFFRRTYLTESLRSLVETAARRLTGKSGDPVVQLQTNFGGGKTHSMLALFHLFSGIQPTELPGVETILQEAEISSLPTARRVVLVGNKISPGSPVTKPDGCVIRTIWGELAWQLGGKEAFERVKKDDENATNPGDVLRELFNEYGPCLILIDEWVAYARQLHEQSDLPGGSFETQFTFAQALTESARASKNCLVVISLPASDTPGSPHTRADDAEVGGQRGREALERLRNVVGRMESSWRPASSEEGFEIVRRRLFEPIADPSLFKDRDVVARAFADFYRAQHQELPPECRERDYENRIKAAYPIHPEVFDRLYTDWSTLAKFQRTRGVLRLMATVIHSLWRRGDKNPLILPGNIPIDDKRVQSELTRYLSDNWVPILEKDIDGPNSLPVQIDTEVSNLGKFQACVRVARTIYLGSAPISTAANRGLEDRRIKLGCIVPGESPAVFGDALRRLAGKATYLYQDGNRYWYSTQPTVTKLAEDRAEQMKREPDKVVHELDQRIRRDLHATGEFRRVHALPSSTADISDDMESSLVVLGIPNEYSKDADNAAYKIASEMLERRGTAPRIYRNTLVFLAPDHARVQDLDEAIRKYLAWESILLEKDTLDLSPHQVKQAEMQKVGADRTVISRIPECYQWLIVPFQTSPQSAMKWQAIRLSGQASLAVRASTKLISEELLVAKLGPTRLRHEMDTIPLWKGNHIGINTLVEYFAQYLYLPRLKDPGVLCNAISEGITLLTWEKDSFAYAESFNDEEDRYRGLRTLRPVQITASDRTLIVKPDIARKQLDAEKVPQSPTEGPDGGEEGGSTGGGPSGPTPPDWPPGPQKKKLKRYHGTVTLDPMRTGRDASRIADEVISHLVGLLGSKVNVTLEIEAEHSDGYPENVVRTVTENSQTLKFKNHGFEKE